MTASLPAALPFDPERLLQLAAEHHDAYVDGDPFAHAVLENLVPDEVLERVLAEFPVPGDGMWQKFGDAAQNKKLAASRDVDMGAATRWLLYHLNSAPFIEFLERLTGIDGLIPDPHFLGGGLHQTQPGGFLKVHTDFNKHRRLNLDRRLNVICYLNKNWLEEYGGHLELWDRDMSVCGRRVLPLFNRWVVFSTTDFSYHGHPDPLQSPPGVTRKSLALYYYTNGRPGEELSPAHTTIFKKRPGERFAFDAKFLALKLLPPVLLDARDYVSRRLRRRK